MNDKSNIPIRSTNRQKYLNRFRKLIKTYLTKGNSVFVDEYPKWSVYGTSTDEPINGSWNYGCFENAIAYKILKDGITK